jgi:hypothetical protein
MPPLPDVLEGKGYKHSRARPSLETEPNKADLGSLMILNREHVASRY